MSSIINQNYSQFYKGTESLKSYGSNTAGKKEKLVRYEFNTHDEKGNKIMDQMSREETLQAMKDIRAQYGNDVMIEFSGDGMAKLVESRKYGHGQGADLDEIMGVSAAKRTIPDDMVTQLEGTYREVSDSDLDRMKETWHSKLREASPEVCDELDGFMARIFDHAANHKNDGEKFGDEFIKLVQKAETAIAEYAEKEVDKEDNSSIATAGEAQLSKTAQEFLKKLRATYGNMDFFVADFSRGDNAKDILAGARNEYSVILSAEEIEKMAADEKYAAEYMDKVQGAVRMSERINREFGFTSAFGEKGNIKVSKIGIAVDENGMTTFFAEFEKSSKQQRERIEERRTEKKEQAEHTFVQADSIEDLIKQIKNETAAKD